MNEYRWRTVDIVVTAVIAVAFGVIFWAWNLLWFGPFSTIFASVPQYAAVVNGVWFIPAVLAPMIIRKPGAGLFAETVAAIISALLGSAWGLSVLWYGLVQGAMGEAGFVAFGYKRWTPLQAMLSGALVGAGASVLDIATYTPGEFSFTNKVIYVVLQMASGAIIAGLGSAALTKALSSTGALDPFPSGQARELV
jgi:energy-coupling factor transport system permease protein